MATITNAKLIQAMKLAKSYNEVTKGETTLRANHPVGQEVNKRKLVLLLRCMREVRSYWRKNYKEAFLRTFTHIYDEAKVWKDFLTESDAH